MQKKYFKNKKRITTIFYQIGLLKNLHIPVWILKLYQYCFLIFFNILFLFQSYNRLH